MKLIWVLSIVLVFAASPAATQVPDDAFVVPGLRIGKWSLDMTVDDHVRVNGQGEFSTLSHPAYVAGLTVLAWRAIPVSVITKDRRKTDALSMVGGDFKTEKAVGLESARTSIIAAYGNPRMTVTISPTLSMLVYDEVGASFGVENDRVNRIWIFRPRSGTAIWTSGRRPPAPVSTPGERIDRY